MVCYLKEASVALLSCVLVFVPLLFQILQSELQVPAELPSPSESVFYSQVRHACTGSEGTAQAVSVTSSASLVVSGGTVAPERSLPVYQGELCEVAEVELAMPLCCLGCPLRSVVLNKAHQL